MQIIPAIDIKDGRCVRLRQGVAGTETVYGDDPAAVARRWESEGAGLIHLVDLDGAFTGTPRHRDLILEVVRSVEIPVQVAGGIRKSEDIDAYLRGGAGRVVLGTKVVTDREFLKTACRDFPGKISVGLDTRAGRVVVQGWTEDTTVSAVEAARSLDGLGIVSLIFTDVNRDGMLKGPNLDAIAQIARAARIPVIASGGVSSLDDLRALMTLSPIGVAGAIVGKALYAGAFRLSEALALTRNPTAC